MYQVFVVEDESLIRQSIRHIVENMAGPFACCGEASDGEMALSMMQDLMPDILLTDIRMPFLDGFELIRHVRLMMPWVRIIIISGFGDFEYAQKAISLGASRYLLKPLRAPELSEALTEVAAMIEQEKTSNLLPSGYDEDELHNVLHQHFMHQLLGGSADTAVLLERARNLQLEVIYPLYQVAVFSLEDVRHDYRTMQAAIARLMRELAVPLYYLNELEQVTLLLCGSSEEQLSDETYRIVNIVRHQLKDRSPVITTVVGKPVKRLSQVSDAYRQAKELLRNVSAIAAGQVIDVDDTASVTAEIMGFPSPFGAEFQHRLLVCAPEEVHDLFQEYLHSQESDQFNSMLLRYYALVDLLKLCAHIQQRSLPDSDPHQLMAQVSGEHDLFAAAATRADFEAAAEQLMLEIVRANAKLTMPKAPPVIARADAYVAENFCDPNISLMRVARHVGMSPAHFSTVFSQAHGTPFISYLTNLRLDRAKHLLLETDMKLAAIAMEIGYNEPNYFSHVFRKFEGMTPKEYRQLHT